MSISDDEKTWAIQWCFDVKSNYYEDWPGYSETPMTRQEMLFALEECYSKWPHYQFRGHNRNANVLRYRADESLLATKQE